jgi:Brp/Blh family beta-carotene 15,15'-monooxygenase
MTAVSPPLPGLASDRAPTSRRVFGLVVVGTVLVTVMAAVTPQHDTVSATAVVLVIAFLGIPHGAIDHLVEVAPTSSADLPSASAWGPLAGPWRFHLSYVAAMSAYGLVWLVAPAVALVGFLLLSVHHFGQSDLAYLGIARRQQLAVQLSRGVFVVGLPLVAHLPDVGPVIERLGGYDPTSSAWIADHTGAWMLVLLGQQLAVGLLVAPQLRDRSIRRREIATVVVLTALFVLADPLIGFAVYFGLWHSLNHLHVLADVLGHRTGSTSMTVKELARLAAPRSAASVAALTVLVGGAHAAGRSELIIPVVLVFVSMLTLPHMVVVERLWRARAGVEQRC